MAWIAAHPGLVTALGLLGPFVVLNVLAYRHVWAMTHFDPDRGWRRSPGGLTRLQKVRTLLGGLRLARPVLPGRPEDHGLACETHTFPGRKEDLEAWFLPHPCPIGTALLFHGYHACKAKLIPEALAFHDLGYACFLVDFPGCGDSPGVCTTIGFREAEDVAAAARYVRRTWPEQPLTLFGQSMGAAAVLRALARLGVETEAAVLESPFDRLLSTVKARFAPMGVPAFPSAHLLVFWGCLQLRFNGFAYNPVRYARLVRCPVLVLYGSDDRRVHRHEVQAVYDALPGDKELHIFAGLGHESLAGPRPDEWKARVGAFLQSRVPAR
jgi:alpha-beta hydrolase superfamily lysophospholipase